MAQMIPKQVSEGTKSRGEREFFASLASMKDTNDWIILHSVQIANHTAKTQGEADFIVLIPDGGIFVVEVKGGTITFENGKWHTMNRGGVRKEIEPVEQATGEMNSLQTFINEHSGGGDALKQCLWGWCVSRFPTVFSTKTRRFPIYRTSW